MNRRAPIALLALACLAGYRRLPTPEAGPELAVQVTLPVQAAAVSDDGAFLLTGGANGAQLFDVRTGLVFRTFFGNATPIVAVAISADRELVATATERSNAAPGEVRVLRSRTGEELLRIPESARSLSFAPGWGGLVIGLPMATRAVDLTGTLRWACVGRASSFSKERGAVLTVQGETVRACRLDSGAVTDTFRAPGAVRAALHGKAGTVAALGEGQLYLWAAGATVPTSADVSAAGELQGFTVLADGTVAVAGAGALLHLDPTTGTVTRRIPAPPRAAERLATVAGTDLVLDGERELRLVELASGQPRRTIQKRERAPVRVSLSPDGAWLLTTQGHLWDLTLGKLHAAIPRGHEVAFVGDGSRYLVLEEQAAVLYDRRTGKALWRSEGRMHRVALDGGRRRAAFLAGSDGAETLGPILDLQTLTPLETGKLRDLPDRLASVALSPDGQRLALGTWGMFVTVGAFVVDLSSGERWQEPLVTSSFAIRSVAFSATGHLFAAAGDAHAPRLSRVGRVGKGMGVRADEGHRGQVRCVAFSPLDDELLASGGDDGVVRLVASSTGKLRAALQLSGVVESLSFSADGRRLAAGTADGAVHLIDLTRAATIATLVGTGAEDFVTVLPDGRYRASRGALAAVAFRLDLEAYPFDQFELRLHRPHEVLRALGRADEATIELYRTAFRHRLRKAGVPESDGVTGTPPRVTLGPLPTRSEARTVRLVVEADGRGRPLQKLDLHVNGVPVAGRAGVAPTTPGATSARWEVPVVLSRGRNKVQLSAVNVDGVESLRQTIELEGAFDAPAPKLFVLGIGVGEHAQRPLRYAVKDATDVLATLAPVATETRLLKDREVTRASIAAAREWLGRTAVDDTVIVFVSGHGLLDRSLDYWFGTADVDFEEPGKTGVPYDELEGLVDGIPARHKLLLMDTCNSGELDPAEKARLAAAPGPALAVAPEVAGAKGFLKPGAAFVDDTALAELLRELFSDLRRGSGAVVLSSAGGMQLAHEDAALQNGIFTYGLLEGLRTRKADRDGDGVIFTAELRDWVVPRVFELSAGAQRPTTRREQVEFDFPWPERR